MTRVPDEGFVALGALGSVLGPSPVAAVLSGAGPCPGPHPTLLADLRGHERNVLPDHRAQAAAVAERLRREVDRACGAPGDGGSVRSG